MWYIFRRSDGFYLTKSGVWKSRERIDESDILLFPNLSGVNAHMVQFVLDEERYGYCLWRGDDVVRRP